jgi:hypothetical protein
MSKTQPYESYSFLKFIRSPENPENKQGDKTAILSPILLTY